MRQGFIKFFNANKGWGFAKDGEQNFFIHYKDCDQTCRENKTGIVTFQPGQLVSFDVEDNPRGPIAKNVTKVKV